MIAAARRLPLWAAITLLTIAALLGLSATAAAHQPDPLAAALQRAPRRGPYAFSTDITQITVPASKVTNVGRTSTTSQMHLEGETNLRDQAMQMRLWMQGGSVADPASAVAVKVEGGKTYVQQGLGGVARARRPHRRLRAAGRFHGLPGRTA